MIPMLILFVFFFFFFYFFKQMRLRPLIPSVLTGIKFLVPGIDRYPRDCDEKRGGGWWYSDSNCAVWSNLNGLYFDNKTSRAIHWSKLSTVPE